MDTMNKPLEQFHLFSKLPTELRIRCYEFMLGASNDTVLKTPIKYDIEHPAGASERSQYSCHLPTYPKAFDWGVDYCLCNLDKKWKHNPHTCTPLPRVRFYLDQGCSPAILATSKAIYNEAMSELYRSREISLDFRCNWTPMPRESGGPGAPRPRAEHLGGFLMAEFLHRLSPRSMAQIRHLHLPVNDAMLPSWIKARLSHATFPVLLNSISWSMPRLRKLTVHLEKPERTVVRLSKAKIQKWEKNHDGDLEPIDGYVRNVDDRRTGEVYVSGFPQLGPLRKLLRGRRIATEIVSCIFTGSGEIVLMRSTDRPGYYNVLEETVQFLDGKAYERRMKRMEEAQTAKGVLGDGSGLLAL